MEQTIWWLETAPRLQILTAPTQIGWRAKDSASHRFVILGSSVKHFLCGLLVMMLLLALLLLMFLLLLVFFPGAGINPVKILFLCSRVFSLKAFAAAPSCTPSRTSLLLGVHVPIHTVVENGLNRWPQRKLVPFTDFLKVGVCRVTEERLTGQHKQTNKQTNRLFNFY
jgi:hypothetical protein